MTLAVRNGGIWRTVVTPYVRAAGAWRTAKVVYRNIGGTFVRVYPNQLYSNASTPVVLQITGPLYFYSMSFVDLLGNTFLATASYNGPTLSTPLGSRIQVNNFVPQGYWNRFIISGFGTAFASSPASFTQDVLLNTSNWNYNTDVLSLFYAYQASPVSVTVN